MNRLAIRRILKLFSLSRPLQLVPIYIVEPLSITNDGNLFVIVITDTYLELTRATSNAKAKATQMAIIVLDYSVMQYRTMLYLLIDNGMQFVGIFYTTVFSSLELKHPMTTACHRRGCGQPEGINWTVESRLWQYVVEHHGDWELYTQSLNY